MYWQQLKRAVESSHNDLWRQGEGSLPVPWGLPMVLSFSSALGFPKPGSGAECPGLPRTDAQAGHCTKAMNG